jgi:hypothetical protein
VANGEVVAAPMRGFTTNGEVPSVLSGGFAAVGDAPGRFCGERANAGRRGKGRYPRIATASRGCRRGLNGGTRREFSEKARGGGSRRTGSLSHPEAVGLLEKLESYDLPSNLVCLAVKRAAGAASFPTVGV